MFENKSPNDVLAELSVDPSLGLDDKEIERRRALYGENKLQEGKKKGPLAIFLGEFKDPMVIVLFVAALISMIVVQYFAKAIIEAALGTPLAYLCCNYIRKNYA